MRTRLFFIMALFFVVQAVAEIPEKKQTTLGLYVNAQEAFAKWHTDKENVKILDVRTEGEYIFVGHARMAYNIPLKFLVGVNDAGKPVTKKNEKFVDAVTAKFAKTDVILIMCRSGGRSATAVNLLAEAGFVNAYTIYDGFEGDTLDFPNSYDHGKRILNGWKNSGAPWTYDLDTSLTYTNIDTK